MTRKHFIAIAYAMRVQKPQPFTGYTGNPTTDAIQEAIAYGEMTQWERCVMALVPALKSANSNFRESLFLVACGYTLRTDGAMYTINWDRGVIA